MKEYLVVGSTHIDLAFKKSFREQSELLESFIVLLLDILAQHQEFTYILEQAIHLRELGQRRPDLIVRLKEYVNAGRLEVVGGSASLLDCNFPNGEYFIKNHQIGMKWVKDTFNVDIETGWLIDTFGLNAQIPQIYKQLGIPCLMANRFGGNKRDDVFVSRGIDGSELLMAGMDAFSAYVKPGNVAFYHWNTWEQLDKFFDAAEALKGAGPLLVMPYTENETRLSYHIIDCVENHRARQNGSVWRFALLKDFFRQIKESNQIWPVISADLNAEFTGTFSLRTEIKLANRKVETLLLEAEKWSALSGIPIDEEALEEAWWTLAYIHFHDVFTGSHPSNVFDDIMMKFMQIEVLAKGILDAAIRGLSSPVQARDDIYTVCALNGLPFPRRTILRAPMNHFAGGVDSVNCNGQAVPFDVKGGELCILADIPATSSCEFKIKKGGCTQKRFVQVSSATIENELLKLECDSKTGIKCLANKKNNTTIMQNVGDFLVIQRDNGNFQMERITSGEIPAVTAEIELFILEPSKVSQSILLKGEFPHLAWMGEGNHLRWEIEFELTNGTEYLDVRLRLDWLGENSRIRLKLPTSIRQSRGIFEIPFGIIERHPYPETENAKGEWPTQRFAAIQGENHGLALVNTGVAGVEIVEGTLWSTMIRAPKAEYIGLVPDESSSQHGKHEYHFALLPYVGELADSTVASVAQQLNNPAHLLLQQGLALDHASASCAVEIHSPNVVLSTIKRYHKNSTEKVLRAYETMGKECHCAISINNASAVWLSDLREEKGEQVFFANSSLMLDFMPFEIKTIIYRNEVSAGGNSFL